MQYIIQNLVFPTEPKHLACRELFYRGDHGVLEDEGLALGFAQRVDLVTYLNACSWQKWQKWTRAKGLRLHLEISGKVRVELLGYHKKAFSDVEERFAQEDFEAEERTEVVLEFPENDEQMVGCIVTALSPQARIYGGYYTVEVEEAELNEITLAIASTTFRKEEFIRKNVAAIRQELLEKDDEAAEHIYLHVVDNGRTLTEEEIAGPHISLHPNPNTGGSGGFARGMIEALEQEPKATHVLLMDDDVLVLPDSIRRTYALLRLLKPEYSEYFINGAMLYYEQPNKQHEDIGTVEHSDGKGQPLKEAFDHTELANNLANEQEYPTQRGQYGAWWFCCMPVSAIEKYGLPLPIFVRADDIEYSIRAGAKFLTMNGICVWHMGFDAKYNAALVYQGYRNNLLGAAFSDTVSNEGIFRTTYDGYRAEMMRFRYDAAEAIVCALEDFLKGPDFLREARGEELMTEKSALTDKLVPLAEIEGFEVPPLERLWDNPEPSLKTRLFLKMTWNGQKWCPKKTHGRRAVTAFNWSLQPELVAGRDKILAVNAFDLTGVVYEKNRERFDELHARYEKAAKEYREHGEEIIRQYREAREELTSVEFWKKYLGIDE